MHTRLLGRILMTNASNKAVVVDESSGKEITDPKDEVAALMRAVAAETPDEPGSGKFAVVQAGDEVVFTAQSETDGQVALVLQRASQCPAVTVPGTAVPLDQLLPVTP